MNVTLERTLYLSLLVLLSGALLWEGSQQTALARQVDLKPEALYKQMLAAGQTIQIVDVRPLSDTEDEDVGGYEETRIPGALPFPGCDPGRTPEGARARIYSYVPTVIVSRDGNPALLEACAEHFRVARNLAGGMIAWVDRGYPEDSGDYVAPKPGPGGGCL